MIRDLLIPQTWPKPVQMLFGIALENWVRYALFAGFAWLLAYTDLQKELVADGRSFKKIRRCRCATGVEMVPAHRAHLRTRRRCDDDPLGKFYGWQVYRKIDSHGWAWFVASIGIAIVVHDTWFYWTHGSCITDVCSSSSTACITRAPIPARGPPILCSAGGRSAGGHLPAAYVSRCPCIR
jgi:hypothetical protein